MQLKMFFSSLVFNKGFLLLMVVVVVKLCILNKHILYYNPLSRILSVREMLAQCYKSDKKETIDRRKLLDFNGLIISSSLDYFIC